MILGKDCGVIGFSHRPVSAIKQDFVLVMGSLLGCVLHKHLPSQTVMITGFFSPKGERTVMSFGPPMLKLENMKIEVVD